MDCVAERYSVNATPMTFLLDKEGKVVAQNLHGEKLKAKIEELLKGKPAEAKPEAKPAEEKPAESKESRCKKNKCQDFELSRKR